MEDSMRVWIFDLIVLDGFFYLKKDAKNDLTITIIKSNKGGDKKYQFIKQEKKKKGN
jgi:hypothetical protein